MSKEKSTIPVKHGFPNPCYGQALDLIRNVSAYRQLAARVRAEAAKMKQSGSFDMAKLFQQCADVGVKGELKNLFERHVNVPKEQPVLGPPPPTSELYGRFGKGTAIVDIGSGNCMKLVRSSGTLNITAVDPKLVNATKIVLTPFTATLKEFLAVTPNPLDLIFSSFMALPQMEFAEWGPLVNSDGLHMVPDHAQLLKNRIALAREDGKILVRTGVCDYIDHAVDLPGVVIEPGYMICPTFKQREVHIKLAPEVVEQRYSPVIDAKPAGFYDLNFSDLGPKFDGVAKELECDVGQAYLVDRAGKQRIGLCSVDFHFCLHLEELDDCYILIRVVAWRGMVPPHHGDMMRLFIEKITLTIDEKPILASPRWDGGSLRDGPLLNYKTKDGVYHFRPPIDGVISRENGNDSYCKYMWTVDITEASLPAIKKMLLDGGYKLEVVGSLGRELMECALQREGSVVTIKPLKPRVDKTRETAPDTVLYLVDRPTLGETELITGSKMMV